MFKEKFLLQKMTEKPQNLEAPKEQEKKTDDSIKEKAKLMSSEDIEKSLEEADRKLDEAMKKLDNLGKSTEEKEAAKQRGRDIAKDIVGDISDIAPKPENIAKPEKDTEKEAAKQRGRDMAKEIMGDMTNIVPPPNITASLSKEKENKA